MSNYIGVRCPVCNRKFTAADDIVVCPICGAPHHRDCYAQENQCVFVRDHITGKEWKAPVEPSQPADGASGVETKACPRCNAPNPGESIYCQICGTPLNAGQPQPGGEKQWQEWSIPGIQFQIDPISMAYGGLSPEEEIDGIPVKDLAVYIGNSSAYYLPRFKVLSETGRSLSINIAALFFNFFYYFYRKMYLVGSILLGLFIVSTIPNILYAMEVLPNMLYEMGMGPAVEINNAAAQHFLSLSNLTRSINFAIGLIISLCANRFYYSGTVASVGKLRAARDSKNIPLEAYQKSLSDSGGCSKAAVIVLAVTLFAAYFITSCIMSFVMLSL